MTHSSPSGIIGGRMAASENQFFLACEASRNRRRVKRQISAIFIVVVLWAGADAAQTATSPHEINRPPKAQTAASLDQILDHLTDSKLNQEGLDQSNLAIDQLVQKANKLIRKAGKARNKELNGKDPQSPLGQVLGEAVLALTDSNAYLLKLKELQNALAAVQALTNGPKVDPHETCQELNLDFQAIGTDLRNLKLGIKTLPLGERAIADVIAWDVESRLNSAIQRIRLRTIRVGKALTLEPELDLEAP